ncbi:hypothetical protein [Mesorhizobium sp. IMUNJ 23232]|uniref:hypothetical protein n=1 Tax=Mesorhizobium sp. IMUNJ 23232 TaxID=3376064 RepID=UPI003792008C
MNNRKMIQPSPLRVDQPNTPLKGAPGGTAVQADQRSNTEKLRYLHGMLRELRDISEAERMQFLWHLLEMAYIDSGDILRAHNQTQILKN